MKNFKAQYKKDYQKADELVIEFAGIFIEKFNELDEEIEGDMYDIIYYLIEEEMEEIYYDLDENIECFIDNIWDIIEIVEKNQNKKYKESYLGGEMKMRKQYYIVGDTKKYKECLIYIVGESYEYAEKVLNRILTNPTEQDKFMLKTHNNIRINSIDTENCWWEDTCE